MKKTCTAWNENVVRSHDPFLLRESGESLHFRGAIDADSHPHIAYQHPVDDDSSMSLDQLPVVRPLGKGVNACRVFTSIAGLPRRIWLDSASRPVLTDRQDIGRYSYLSADPVAWISASVGEDDPWPLIDRWCRLLSPAARADLPPFQCGIAGLIGYEAATWLERVAVATNDDLPTPAIALGLYDWVVAIDHHQDTAWLISQGYANHDVDPNERLSRAHSRAHQILSLLSKPGPERSPLSTATTSLSKQSETHHCDVTSNFGSRDFRTAIHEIVGRIGQGDSFQVNLAQRLVT
ncbi:MAG: hypothetical protein AAGA03_10500, partial [Planctomycetota bacterium]